MAVHIAIPIAGGIALVTAIGLRIRAVAKKKAIVPPGAVAGSIPVKPPPAPIPLGTSVTPTPAQVQITEETGLPIVLKNPDGSAHEVGTPFVFNTNSDAASAVAEANRRGVPVQQIVLERTRQLQQTDGTAVAGQKAVVTTMQPAPSGDLIIRNAPNGSQIGGAEKNGTVIVIIPDVGDGIFAEIDWPGGNRLPAARGFAKKKFLKLI